MVRHRLTPLALVLAACSTSTSTSVSSSTSVAPAAAGADAAPADGEALIRQMHQRYAGKWYKTLTFSQQTTRTRPDGTTRQDTWYEAGSIPGKLRIDIAPIDSMNAIVFVGDSTFRFRGGKLMGADKDRNLLMTLGFDVYGQPPETTLAQLRAEGIDLSKLREDTWQGTPVYVVGAAAGDSTTNQFWIEKDRMLFVRLIQQLPKNPNQPDAPAPLLDVTFNKYQKLGKGWVAPDVGIRVNGKEVQHESYSDIRADVPLGATLYDTREYHRPEWVEKK